LRNILKGFLNPKAEEYIFPDADTIEMEAPPVPGDQPGEEPAGEEAGFDYTEPAEDGQEEPEAPPALEEETADGGEPSQSGSGGVVQYAQLQAELILKQAREEAETILAGARAAAKAEQEEIRMGARDEGYREGYAQGTARAMEDAQRDREAMAEQMEKEVQAFLEKADMAREGVDFFDTLRDEGLGDIIKETVAAQTLGSTMRAYVEEHGALSEALGKVINTYETFDIYRRKETRKGGKAV